MATIAIIALVAGSAGVACSGSETTQPSESAALKDVEIVFARDIGNPAAAILDTVTLEATVRDEDGNEVSDVNLEWRLNMPGGGTGNLNLGSITRSGPRTAVMKLNLWQARILVRASRPNQLPVWGQLEVSLGPPRRDMFVWSRETGFSRVVPPEGAIAHPRAINNLGQIVGWLEFPFSQLSRRAFLWSSSTGFILLDATAGNSSRSVASGINDAGMVSGWVDRESFTRLFIWNAGSGMSVVTNATASLGDATFINASGQIAGDAAGKAFRWSSETGLQFLRLTPQYPNSYVVAFNDAGDVLGYDGEWGYWSSTLQNPAAVLWSADGERTYFANCSRPCGMSVAGLNNRRQVAGTINDEPFRWSEKDGFSKLQVTGDVLGINENGDILVATSIDYLVARPSLWTNDGKLIDVGIIPGALQFQPVDLNDRGQVVGYVR